MSRFFQDSRYAFRTFLRGRFVTVLAVLAFALGIGVTTAVFSIFSGILLTPLPYPNGDELVIVYDTQPALPTAPASFPRYHDWKDRNTVFAAIGGSTQASFVMTGVGEPELVAGIATTASLGDVLGVSPALGRWYTEQEDTPNGPKVVVLNHDRTGRAGSSPTAVSSRLCGRPLADRRRPLRPVAARPHADARAGQRRSRRRYANRQQRWIDIWKRPGGRGDRRGIRAAGWLRAPRQEPDHAAAA